MVDPFSLDDKELPLSVRQRIDEVCIAFEDAWKSGERPGTKDFVTKLPDSVRSTLFRELLLIELDYRRRHGDKLSAEELP